MKRYTFLIFWLLSFLVLPELAFADPQQSGGLLTPSPDDLSVDYLSNIFGVVDGVFHGSGSQILGQIFSVINSGCMILASSVLGYLTIMGTVHTANEGEFLGRRWSSVLVPLRTVLGIFLLVPRATGYSTIQIGFLWFIVQGIGMADSVATKAIDYLKEGGIVLQQDAKLNAPELSLPVAAIFSREICLYTLQNALQAGYAQQVAAGQPPANPPPQSLLGSVVPLPLGTNSVDFPGDLTSQGFPGLKGFCGSFNWEPVMPDKKKQAISVEDQQLQNLAVQQLIIDLAGPAQAVANAILPADPTLFPIEFPPISSVANLDYNANPLSQMVPTTFMADAMSDYDGMIMPILNRLHEQKKEDSELKHLDKNNDLGWLMGGTYYWFIVATNKQYTKAMDALGLKNSADIPEVESNKIYEAIKAGEGSLPTYAQSYAPQIESIYNEDQHSSSNYFTVNFMFSRQSLVYQGIKYANEVNSTYGGQTAHVGFNAEAYHQALGVLGSIGGFLDSVINPFSPVFAFFGGIFELGADLGPMIHAQELGLNPLAESSNLGSAAMNVGFHGLLAMAKSMEKKGLEIQTETLGQGTGLNVVEESVLSALTPIALAVCLPLIVSGAIMAYYLPVMPVIYFDLMALEWMIAVIGASFFVVPLVVKWILNAEDEGLFGNLRHGTMGLFVLILTPSIMVVSAYITIQMSYIGLWLLNKTYWVYFDPSNHLVAQYINGISYLFFLPAEIVIFAGLATYLNTMTCSIGMKFVQQAQNLLEGQAGMDLGSVQTGAGQAKESLSTPAQSLGQGAQNMPSGAREGATKAGEANNAGENVKAKKAEQDALKQQMEEAKKKASSDQSGNGGNDGKGSQGASPLGQQSSSQGTSDLKTTAQQGGQQAAEDMVLL